MAEASTPKALVDIDAFLKFAENVNYLIVGGGTSGLALAARLSEDPDINVGVLEVGASRLNDPNITVPQLFPTLVGNPDYDWDYHTTKQDTLNGTSFRVPRGKVLGGSSAINWMVYARGQKEDYDDWERLGNKGWNWDSLLPYFMKSQNYQGENRNPTFPHDEKVHNIGGPISTSYTPYRFPVENLFHEAAANSGLDWTRNKDPQSGATIGGGRMISSVHRTQNTHVRRYSVNGYFLPIANRENIAVLTEALVTRVLFQTHQETTKATGLEFEHKGLTHAIHVQTEIILSGGSFESPKLLELSGVGDPKILQPLGIDVVVENQQVGANLQDHFVSGIVYELTEGEISLDMLKDPKFLADALQEFGEKGTGILTSHDNAMGSVAFASIASDEAKQELEEIIESYPLRTPSKSAETQRQILADHYCSRASANIQFNLNAARFDASLLHDLPALFAGPGKPGIPHITITDAVRQPFSRGSVHIKSKDAHEQVSIDPGYLNHPADIKILSAGLRALDKIAKSEPLASKIARREFPPQDFDLSNSAALEEWLKKHITHEWHPVGSCSMGEVVDERLKVLGVQGLRVVDCSIIPLGTSANTQSIAYAIAEKAADMIKEDRAKH